jgi:hypothetical protein
MAFFAQLQLQLQLQLQAQARAATPCLLPAQRDGEGRAHDGHADLKLKRWPSSPTYRWTMPDLSTAARLATTLRRCWLTPHRCLTAWTAARLIHDGLEMGAPCCPATGRRCRARFALFYLRSLAPKTDYMDKVTNKRIAAFKTGDSYKGGGRLRVAAGDMWSRPWSGSPRSSTAWAR